jgi:hypothetical protein
MGKSIKAVKFTKVISFRELSMFTLKLQLRITAMLNWQFFPDTTYKGMSFNQYPRLASCWSFFGG